MLCRICESTQLNTIYEHKYGVCKKCQEIINQREAKILAKRRFFRKVFMAG